MKRNDKHKTPIFRVLRFFNTVKYMSCRQWFYRIRNTLLKIKTRKPITKHIYDYTPVFYMYNSRKINEKAVCNAERIIKNRFEIVSGINICFESDDIDWDLVNNNYRLICFRFNSFKYLLDLSDAYKITKNKAYIYKGFALIKNWHKRCGYIIKGDKWNPYVIAERIMNWIGFFSEYADDCDFKENLLSWIASQAAELKKTIEYQMGANHLLSEAKALMYAGVFLKDKKLYDYGRRILKKEFNSQFLGDGGNFERSISYHIEALQQYFEAVMLMRNIKDAEEKNLTELMIDPYVYLNSMICADGHIPLINDSAYDYPFDAKDFLNTSLPLFGTEAPNGVSGAYSMRWSNNPQKLNINWVTDAFHRSTGFYLEHYSINNTQYSFFFDAGKVGADINPGHAHADSLNILWVSDEGPIIVDSGVFTYKPGNDRDLCRGTAAHNTIEIDDTDSSEVWAAFRMAKRANTRIEKYNSTKENVLLSASHDGYAKVLKKPVIHKRTMKLNKVTGKIDIEDSLVGRGKHKGVISFHMAPNCKIESKDSYTIIINDKYVLKCSEKICLVDSKIAQLFGVLSSSICIRAIFFFEGDKNISTEISHRTGEIEANG